MVSATSTCGCACETAFVTGCKATFASDGGIARLGSTVPCSLSLNAPQLPPGERAEGLLAKAELAVLLHSSPPLSRGPVGSAARAQSPLESVSDCGHIAAASCLYCLYLDLAE